MTIGNNNIQEQSPQVFYKKICSYKFGNIHTKSTGLGISFKKVTSFQATKGALTQVFSCEYCQIFTNTYFDANGLFRICLSLLVIN